MDISWKRKATQTETVRSPCCRWQLLSGLAESSIRTGGKIHR